jgi:uncharacterized protein (TIGR01244 family)
MKTAAMIVCVMTTVVLAQEPTKTNPIEQSLKDDIPRVLCVDKNFTTGGQPSERAYEKLAANGFKSVLSLRTANEGVDLGRERELIEKSGMRFVSIPVVSSQPTPEQAEEFIKTVKNNSLQPMLIHCASANRVGAFWMIYRVLDQGWPEDKALDEATKIGLTSPGLKKFAQDYIASHRKVSK